LHSPIGDIKKINQQR